MLGLNFGLPADGGAPSWREARDGVGGDTPVVPRLPAVPLGSAGRWAEPCPPAWGSGQELAVPRCRSGVGGADCPGGEDLSGVGGSAGCAGAGVW